MFTTWNFCTSWLIKSSIIIIFLFCFLALHHICCFQPVYNKKSRAECGQEPQPPLVRVLNSDRKKGKGCVRNQGQQTAAGLEKPPQCSSVISKTWDVVGGEVALSLLVVNTGYRLSVFNDTHRSKDGSGPGPRRDCSSGRTATSATATNFRFCQPPRHRHKSEWESGLVKIRRICPVKTKKNRSVFDSKWKYVKDAIFF